jgi:hypothetical protein
MTEDGVTVGAFGTIFLQVSDATKFVFSLVAGQQTYTEDKIESWIKNTVNGAMRPELASRNVHSLMAERDTFVQACKNKLTPLFDEWGLQFKHIEMVELTVPVEYRQAVEDVTLAGFGRQKAIIDAKTEAEVVQLKAQAQANARLMAGTADVEVFALMQAHGPDPVKMETIKTLVEYAKAASTGGGMISGDLYKPQVFAMLSQVLLDPTIPGGIRQTVKQMFPQQSAKIPDLPAAGDPAPLKPLLSNGHPEEVSPAQITVSPVPSTESPLTIEKVNAMLDSLDIQLAEGKLSEGTYNALRQKWEGRLREMGPTAPE